MLVTNSASFIGFIERTLAFPTMPFHVGHSGSGMVLVYRQASEILIWDQESPFRPEKPGDRIGLDALAYFLNRVREGKTCQDSQFLEFLRVSLD